MVAIPPPRGSRELLLETRGGSRLVMGAVASSGSCKQHVTSTVAASGTTAHASAKRRHGASDPQSGCQSPAIGTSCKIASAATAVYSEPTIQKHAMLTTCLVKGRQVGERPLEAARLSPRGGGEAPSGLGLTLGVPGWPEPPGAR